MTEALKAVFTVLPLALLFSACGYKTVYMPYAGTTPDMPLAQARDMCENMAKLAEQRAESAYDEANPDQSAGGFWGGMAHGGSRNLKGNEAYDATFDGCMAEQGYRRTRVKHQETAQRTDTTAGASPVARTLPEEDIADRASMLRANLTAYPVSYLGSGAWEEETLPSPEEGYMAPGLLLSSGVWISSPLIGDGFAIMRPAYPEGPAPGVVDGFLMDDELYVARVPAGLAPNAKKVCTADPRGRIGEEVLFLFTNGTRLGHRTARIDNVFSDRSGRDYVSIDTKKVVESVGSPVLTTDLCVVGFIGDSEVQKGLANTVARSVTDVLRRIEKAGIAWVAR